MEWGCFCLAEDPASEKWSALGASDGPWTGGCLLRVNFGKGRLLLQLLGCGLYPKQDKVLQDDQGSRGGSVRILEGDYKGRSRVRAASRGFFDTAGSCHTEVGVGRVLGYKCLVANGSGVNGGGGPCNSTMDSIEE